MIYIFAALYQEAGSIIKKLSLKRRQPVLPFQQFEGEGVRLTITGAGQIKAASAVAAVLTERRPEKEDMLLSVGTCADITEYRENAIVSTGEGYIACKLRNLESGRVFYPDLILQMNFPLAEIITGMQIMRDGKRLKGNRTILYDMESAAVYESANQYMGPHQMVFFRIVTDRGDGKTVSAGDIAAASEKSLESVLSLLSRMSEFSEEMKKEKMQIRDEDEKIILAFCNDARFSESMRMRFRQLIRYKMLSGIDWKHELETIREEMQLPCNDRRQGKNVLERCFGGL